MTSVSRLNAREKQRRAVALRMAGITYNEIAKQVGYSSANGAYQAVKAVMKRADVDAVQDLRQVHYERFNFLLSRHWGEAAKGDIKSTEVCLKIMNDMSKLMGIDQPAPVKVEHNHQHVHGANVMVIDGSQEDFIANLQRLALRGNPNLAYTNDGTQTIVDAEIIEEMTKPYKELAQTNGHVPDEPEPPRWLNPEADDDEDEDD